MASGAARSDGAAWRAAIAAELFWIEETCACAAQWQHDTARSWRAANLLLGVLAVLPGAVAGALMLAGSPRVVAAGALALTAAMTSILVGSLAPGRRAGQATDAAKAYEIVQALARQARLVDLPRQGFEQARSELAELSNRWQSVQRTALPVARFVRIRTEQHAPADPEETMTERMSDVVNVFVPAQRSAEQLS